MSVENCKVAVYGAGAMGTVLGAFLTLGGVRAHLISRNELHVQALKSQGATIECVADEKTIRTDVEAILPSEMTEKYDVIFLMTKQRDNTKTLAFLKDYLKEDGVICTTQNGLPELSLVECIGEEKTYGGVASWGANFLGEGKVELTSKLSAMSIVVGGYQANEPKTALLVEILRCVSKVNGNQDFVKKTEDLLGARWAKLALNSAFSGLSVVTGLEFGEIAKRHKTKKIALRLLREAYAVADAAGIKVEKVQGHDLKKIFGGYGYFQKLLAYCLLPLTMKKHKKLVSGMLKDVQSGKKCEIEFINGVVCRLGREYSVPTPTTQKVVEIVHGIENGLYEIAPENVDFF